MKSDRLFNTVFTIIVICLIFIAIWLLTPKIVSYLFCTEFAGNYDPFAAFSSLFSGLAFVVVVVTLIVQRAEFSEQIKQIRESSTNDLIVPLLMEYRSRKMQDALSALWKFKDEYEGGFLDEYEKTPDQHEIRYQRRLVSHFFGIIAGLYNAKSIPKDILYAYWDKRDLKIIPEVIIPIEKRLDELSPDKQEIDSSTKHSSAKNWEGKLKKLYENAP